MKRPGYDATRRNRNLGTKKSGHGQDNRLVIPWAWADDRIFYERLVDPIEVPVKARSVSTHIIVEPPLSGFTHACTVDDILRVLQMMPVRHLEKIKMYVLRQPKRKERILCPVWGRLVYWSDIGELSGPAVYLDAQDVRRPVKWDKSLKPDQALELERLRRDGHSIVTDKRCHQIESTLDSVRNTQLYRTLPHEIGHYVDYLERVEEPSRNDTNQWSALNDKYQRRLSQEKEAFAHRYADEFQKLHRERGLLPFDRILNEAIIKQNGMATEWFTPNAD